MPKKLFRAVYALNYIFQTGFSMVVPVGLFVLAGRLLTARLGVGKWAMAVCIILGVLAGFFCVFRFLLTTARQIDPTSASEEDGHERKQ